MSFLGWLLQYAVIFVILVAIAGLGIFFGVKWRKSKDAKAAQQEEINTAAEEK